MIEKLKEMMYVVKMYIRTFDPFFESDQGILTIVKNREDGMKFIKEYVDYNCSKGYAKADSFTQTELMSLATFTDGDKKWQWEFGIYPAPVYNKDAAPVPNEKQNNNTDLVDLGLPSGTLWMTHNVGAIKPEDAGKYFAWGDTEGFYANEIPSGSFTSDWYATRKGHGLTGDIVPGGEYDAVTAAYGAGFQMPTKEDFKELTGNTDMSVETINGISGTKFTNRTDSTKFIFIPFAGCCYYEGVYGVGYHSFVWSSTISKNDSSGAWCLYCDNDGDVYMGIYDRYFGYSVRGVYKK